uniref:Uncharacterized protein n=1 Tax=Betula platyphylla TaxID=78630 RepID=A0A5B9G1B6_BETPL|nr:hypothetical protein [Betula platyphylla]
MYDSKKAYECEFLRLSKHQAEIKTISLVEGVFSATSLTTDSKKAHVSMKRWKQKARSMGGPCPPTYNNGLPGKWTFSELTGMGTVGHIRKKERRRI